MQFSTIIISTALFLVSGSHAWTNGIANNNFYDIRNIHIHEACTYEGTETFRSIGDSCVYWIDGAGNQYHGTCTEYPSQILCI